MYIVQWLPRNENLLNPDMGSLIVSFVGLGDSIRNEIYLYISYTYIYVDIYMYICIMESSSSLIKAGGKGIPGILNISHLVARYRNKRIIESNDNYTQNK